MNRLTRRSMSPLTQDILGTLLIVGVIGAGIGALYLAHGAQAEAADFQTMSDGAICRPLKEAPGTSLCTRTVRYLITPKGEAVELDKGAL